jgi:CheY-like chemotaxis protein
MATVLIVDDSMSARLLLKKRLENHGYNTVEAEGGEAALALLEQEKVDVVLLDLLMSDMHGTEVLERMRAQGMVVPVIILSSDIQKATKDRCYELGAFDFMNKPVLEDKELLSYLEKALDRRS